MKSHRARSAIWALTLLPLAICPGCASTAPAGCAPTVQVVPLHLDPDLLQCLPQPAAPEGAVTGLALDTWIQALIDAGQDCRERLAQVRRASE